MAEIVNLRAARKQRARNQSEQRAAENRVLFGATKAQKEADRAARNLSERRLEGHRRENGDDAEK